MNKAFRFILLAFSGAIVMVACLLWVAQFFRLEGEHTPVIWLQEVKQNAQSESAEAFAEFEGAESH